MSGYTAQNVRGNAEFPNRINETGGGESESIEFRIRGTDRLNGASGPVDSGLRRYGGAARINLPPCPTESRREPGKGFAWRREPKPADRTHGPNLAKRATTRAGGFLLPCFAPLTPWQQTGRQATAGACLNALKRAAQPPRSGSRTTNGSHQRIKPFFIPQQLP